MKRTTVALAVATMLAVAVIIGLWLGQHAPPPKPRPVPQTWKPQIPPLKEWPSVTPQLRPDFVLTAAALNQEMEADWSSVEKKYRDKILQLEGVVVMRPLVTPFGERQIVTIGCSEGDDVAAVAECTVRYRPPVDLGSLRCGQPVTIIGKCAGKTSVPYPQRLKARVKPSKDRFQVPEIPKIPTFSTDCIALLDCQLHKVASLPVSATQLIDACVENEDAFRNKYEGLWLEVDGLVADVGREGRFFVHVQGKGKKDSPRIAFDYTSEHKKHVEKLKIGGPIKVQGRCLGKGPSGQIVMADVTLVN